MVYVCTMLYVCMLIVGWKGFHGWFPTPALVYILQPAALPSGSIINPHKFLQVCQTLFHAGATPKIMHHFVFPPLTYMYACTVWLQQTRIGLSLFDVQGLGYLKESVSPPFPPPPPPPPFYVRVPMFGRLLNQQYTHPRTCVYYHVANLQQGCLAMCCFST